MSLSISEDINLKKIYDRITPDRKALLKLVVLLHDCGKGKSRDHSIVGYLFAVYPKRLD